MDPKRLAQERPSRPPRLETGLETRGLGPPQKETGGAPHEPRLPRRPAPPGRGQAVPPPPPPRGRREAPARDDPPPTTAVRRDPRPALAPAPGGGARGRAPRERPGHRRPRRAPVLGPPCAPPVPRRARRVGALRRVRVTGNGLEAAAAGEEDATVAAAARARRKTEGARGRVRAHGEEAAHDRAVPVLTGRRRRAPRASAAPDSAACPSPPRAPGPNFESRGTSPDCPLPTPRPTVPGPPTLDPLEGLMTVRTPS